MHTGTMTNGHAYCRYTIGPHGQDLPVGDGIQLIAGKVTCAILSVLQGNKAARQCCLPGFHPTTPMCCLQDTLTTRQPIAFYFAIGAVAGWTGCASDIVRRGTCYLLDRLLKSNKGACAADTRTPRNGCPQATPNPCLLLLPCYMTTV